MANIPNTPNIPMPASPTMAADVTFPTDLTNNYRNYFMAFTFLEYSRSDLTAPVSTSIRGSIALPLPDKINDQSTVIWNQQSMRDQFASRVLGNIATQAVEYGGYLSGLALNPFLVQLFDKPTFKDFNFSWTLAPNTAEESDRINTIVKMFRKNMLPSKNAATTIGGVSGLLKYPNVLKIKFNPDNYLFKFKPCAIKSVNIDYNPSSNPSFYVTGAPAQVRISISVTEIEYWTADDQDLS